MTFRRILRSFGSREFNGFVGILLLVLVTALGIWVLRLQNAVNDLEVITRATRLAVCEAQARTSAVLRGDVELSNQCKQVLERSDK